jgi:YVTN family beta-propeller protein
VSLLKTVTCALVIAFAGAVCGGSSTPAAPVQAELRTGRDPGPALVAAGAVWVPNEADGTVSRIDPATTRIAATVTIGDPQVMLARGCGVDSVHSLMWDTLLYRRCSLPSALTSDGRSIWAADNVARGLARIDPRTNRVVQRFSIGADPFAIAWGFGSLWVTSYFNDPQEVLRVDPTSGRVLAAISGPAMGGTGIVVGAGAVWVAATYAGTLARIDPATNTITATVPVESYPLALAAGDGSVWVRNEDSSSVSRVDPATGRVTATVRGLNSLPQTHPDDSMTLGRDGLWIAGLELLRVDPRGNRLAARIDATGSAVAEGYGSLWLISEFGTLQRVDPASASAIGGGA